MTDGKIKYPFCSSGIGKMEVTSLEIRMDKEVWTPEICSNLLFKTIKAAVRLIMNMIKAGLIPCSCFEEEDMKIVILLAAL